MKYLRICPIALMAMALPNLALALDLQTLTEVRNDRNANVSRLSAELDGENHLQGIAFDTWHNGDGKDGQETHLSFSLARIEGTGGVVLDTDQGHKTILMSGSLDPGADAGTFIVSYLKNGLLGTYKACPVRIARDDGGTWRLINIHTGAPVTEIYVKTWFLGITDLQGICE